MNEPTRPQEVGTILRIIHLLGGRASFSDISNPQLPQTLHEERYSADLIRRALDALSGGSDRYLHLLDQLEAERGRGRPRIPFQIKYNSFHNVAITTQRRFFIAYIADLTGAPVHNLMIERTWREPNLQDLYEGLKEIFRLYNALPEAEQRPFLSIALTAPGPIDIERGIIQSRQMGELRGYGLRDDLSEKFQLKTLLHEDSQAFALAELYSSKRDLSLIAITLGEGFGYAICLKGRLLEGTSGPLWQSSSHFVVPGVEPALVCDYCHRAGCIRAFLGQSGRNRLQASPEWRDSLAAQRLVNDLLAHIIAIQVITIDPPRVVLDIGTQYLERPMASPDEAPIYDPSFLIPRIRELASVPGRPIPIIEMSKLEPSPRARGAGILPLHYLFHRPDVDFWFSPTRRAL